MPIIERATAHTARFAVLSALIVSLPVARLAFGQESGSRLPSVTIVGSMTGVSDAGRTVEVISRDDIARAAARNLAELLALRSGMDVYGRSAAQADLSVRASTAEQTLILVDGVRVSDVQSSHYALDLAVPLDDIERVEILKGAGSALYGPDAVGGVVNIVTRDGYRGEEWRARGGAWGTAGTAGRFGTNAGRWNVGSAFEYEKADGWRPGTDHRIGSARIALTRTSGENRLQAHLGTGVRDFGASAFYGPYNSTERTGATTADASWRTLAAGWLFSATASTRYHTDRFTLVRDNPAIYENLHRSWQSGGDVLARRTVGHTAFALAADLANYQLVSARLGSRHEWREGGAAQATWGGTGATLDLGARADQSSIYGGFLSPSVAASVPVGGGVRVRASASRGFRAPTWTERYYSDPVNRGNAELVPEQFWSGETGARVAAGNNVLDVALFARRAENLIDWVKPTGASAATPWQATNVGSANYTGVESSLALAPIAGVTYSVSAMLVDFTDRQGAGLAGKYALRPLTRQLTARARWSATSRVGISVEAMQARRSGEDLFATGNARVTYEASAQWALTLDGTNLANATWLDASGMIVAGRALFAGLSWKGR